MKVYDSRDIRNVTFLGHSGAGKTSLVESILHNCGHLKEKGSVARGSTVSDFTKEERDRKISISSSLIPVECEGIKFNILDTPGFFDFVGEVYSSFIACESGVLVLNSLYGSEVGFEKSWKHLERLEKPRLIFANKMDQEDIDIRKLVVELQETYGQNIIPINLPLLDESSLSGTYNLIREEDKELDVYNDLKEEYRSMLIEKVAEASEENMEKYFNEEDFTEEEIIRALKEQVLNLDFVPLVFGSSQAGVGVDDLLYSLRYMMPSPKDIFERKAFIDGEEYKIVVDKKDPFSALVFKTVIDPFVGKLSYCKVMSGSLKNNTAIYNSSKEETEKLGNIFTYRGDSQIALEELQAGDIGVISKLNYTDTGDSICSDDEEILFEDIVYPKANYFSSISPRNKSDEDKIGMSLDRLAQEDPTFKIDRNTETSELLVGGLGNTHLDIIAEKLKNEFDVDVDFHEPKIAYRETIENTVEVHARHKKQSGGAGQFAEVYIRFEPSDEEFEFDEEIFGGAVPKNYFPAVEKGIEESLASGPIASYPVVGIKATLYDGSYHTVDSNEMAFKIAAAQAFKKALKKAKTSLLEPIMTVTIHIPEAYMGDIMADVNKRRGTILGMDQVGNDYIIKAELPQREMIDYSISLRSLTQARGDFELEFSRYEKVPEEVLDEILQTV